MMPITGNKRYEGARGGEVVRVAETGEKTMQVIEAIRRF
jgi:hypothetical protein